MLSTLVIFKGRWKSIKKPGVENGDQLSWSNGYLGQPRKTENGQWPNTNVHRKENGDTSRITQIL